MLNCNIKPFSNPLYKNNRKPKTKPTTLQEKYIRELTMVMVRKREREGKMHFDGKEFLGSEASHFSPCLFFFFLPDKSWFKVFVNKMLQNMGHMDPLLGTLESSSAKANGVIHQNPQIRSSSVSTIELLLI